MLSLWMEIWKAAQLAEKDSASEEPVIASAKKAVAGPSTAKCPS